MKYKLLSILLLLIALNANAQKKNIKVQILHEGEIVVDTTLHMTSDEAKVIIENMVQQFSKEPVNIDTKLTHGLYAFNITNENWKGSNTTKDTTDLNKPDNDDTGNASETSDNWDWADEKNDSRTNEVEMDSLWNEFSHELNEKWDELQIEVVVDSLGVSFKELWNEMEIDINNNPDVQEFKSDLKNFFRDFSKTQFIIIHDGDTIVD